MRLLIIREINNPDQASFLIILDPSLAHVLYRNYVKKIKFVNCTVNGLDGDRASVGPAPSLAAVVFYRTATTDPFDGDLPAEDADLRNACERRRMH